MDDDVEVEMATWRKVAALSSLAVALARVAGTEQRWGGDTGEYVAGADALLGDGSYGSAETIMTRGPWPGPENTPTSPDALRLLRAKPAFSVKDASGVSPSSTAM